MTSTPPPPREPRDDDFFRRPGSEPTRAWEPLPDDPGDDGSPTPTGYVLTGEESPAPAVEEEVDEAAPVRRWRPGMLFAVLLAALGVAAIAWLVLGRGDARPGVEDPPPPVPTAPPTQILLPPPWDDVDLTPPSEDVGFTSPSPRPGAPQGPAPERSVALDGGGAVATRIDADSAAVVVAGSLHRVNLREARVDWSVPAVGRAVTSPRSGALVEVAPDGTAISRVLTTGDELSRGTVAGQPVLCGDVFLDVHDQAVDAYEPHDLEHVLWSARLEAPAGVGGRHLRCREDGRHLLVGEFPHYSLRLTPATREAAVVNGLATEHLRMEMADGVLTLYGEFGASSFAGSHTTTVAEARGVAVTVELVPDGEAVLRGYDVRDGARLWEAPAGDVGRLEGVGDAVVAVAGAGVEVVDPATGATRPLTDLGDMDLAPDAHGNVCRHGTVDEGLRLDCLSPDGGQGWTHTLEGRRLSVEDGIWVAQVGGEVKIFQ